MSEKDPYASRVDSQWQIAPRVDPVVRGTASDGPLKQEQLDAFDRDGFLALTDWISPEQAQRLLDESIALAKERRGSERVIQEPDSQIVRSVFEIHDAAPELARICCSPKFLGVAQQILADDAYIHQSRVNFKPPLNGKEFFWHSDFETWHIEDGMPRMRALSVSINLTESHEFNGPLMVIPGSHRRYVRCVGETPDDHYKISLRKQDYGVPARDALVELTREHGIVAPKGPPGSVVFFDCNMMHGSTGNLSPHPRTNLFFVYNSVENRLVRPFGNTKARPSFIAQREPRVLTVASLEK